MKEHDEGKRDIVSAGSGGGCCGDGGCACNGHGVRNTQHEAPPKKSEPTNGVSRRSFMQTLGLSAAAGAWTTQFEEQAEAQGGSIGGTEIIGPNEMQVTLRINGTPHNVTIDPTQTLMEALRWDLKMTGTKEVCDRGACGGCTVLLDGEVVASCMLLASDAIGHEITTVEGIAQGDQLDPIQEAFIRHDALQCGYCTPGLIVATKALLNTHPKPTLEQIKHGLSGNICRCGTYTNIFNAVLDASGQKPIVDNGAAPTGGA